MYLHGLTWKNMDNIRGKRAGTENQSGMTVDDFTYRCRPIEYLC